MSRRVIITGIGPVSGLGLGIEPTWQALLEGRSAIGPVTMFDPGGFRSRHAGQVPELQISKIVPKHYRKAAKVMARDIEIAVAAADLAARDARLTTRGVAADPATPTSYPPSRVGAHIGAGLIAADLDELTAALVEARGASGEFDIHRWGAEGINHLTPLWLLKYLPNMLACHVTIIHGLQGPSNTITCSEAAGSLSVGESLRVIRRGAADACFCGGADSKLNPMAYLRQHLQDLLADTAGDGAQACVRAMSQSAHGTLLGEGGGILVLEALETFEARRREDPEIAPYAEIRGFAASQTVNREMRNLRPSPTGAAIANAIRAALRKAEIEPEDIDLIIPYGLGHPEFDQPEAVALKAVFGDRLKDIPLTPLKPYTGNCSAGQAGLELSAAAQAIRHGTIPAVIHCDDPLPGLACQTAPARQANIRHVLHYTTSIGGQNAAIVLSKL